MHAPGLTRQSTQYAWRAVDYIVYHTHSGHPDHNDPHVYAEETARWTNDPSLHKVKRNDPFCLGV